MSMNLPSLRLADYIYDLPDEKIAKYPTPQRDQSKLLIYEAGVVSHRRFSQLPEFLPDNSILFFNDTKVIPARFLFEKDTGATIEVFLLNPVFPSGVLSEVMGSLEKTAWKCAIGNSKRWPNDLILRKQTGTITLFARLIDRVNAIVEFSWNPPHFTFAEIVQQMGAVPLPPYIKREPEAADRERYQTIYSHYEGAVAAPTAGLHFTESVLDNLKQKGVLLDFVTLHVSAGTFLPVKAENAVDHVMHEEQIVIRKENIMNLLRTDKKVIAVGTTALRTLESLYWYGVLLIKNPYAEFEISPLIPYEHNTRLPSVSDSLNTILKHMETKDSEVLTGKTSIYIFPGYSFKICEGLITNFHQPGSTLLLLIAAWLGPAWKRVYAEALEHNYRFLSYGDSSLLWHK